MGWPHFCLIEALGWTIGLAIGNVDSTNGEVAIGFSGYSLWKVVINF